MSPEELRQQAIAALTKVGEDIGFYADDAATFAPLYLDAAISALSPAIRRALATEKLAHRAFDLLAYLADTEQQAAHSSAWLWERDLWLEDFAHSRAVGDTE